MADEQQPGPWIKSKYAEFVQGRHPKLMSAWPVITGADVKVVELPGWQAWAFIHTGNSISTSTFGLGEITLSVLSLTERDGSNRELIRSRIDRHLRLKIDDFAFLLRIDDGKLYLDAEELEAALRKHEVAMNLGPMRVFLSHKSVDKTMVRRYNQTLRLIGYDTWIDEDAMRAGANLERALSQGFSDSCAAIFFITDSYKDDGYLATEVEYAIREKRAKGDKFAIVTLVFGGGGQQDVPELLRPYVWKSPAGELEAIQEIVHALPIKVGDINWR